jgi:hypothetical protein
MTFMLRTTDDACFVKFYATKKHDRVQAMLHAFVTPLNAAGEWPASRLGRFTSEENDHRDFCRFSGERQIFAHAVNRTPTFHPIANHYIE